MPRWPEKERRMISVRTKDALAAAKARGKQRGKRAVNDYSWENDLPDVIRLASCAD